MRDFLNLSVYDFLDALASKEPVPGGGGASALAGALAASLGQMVGSLTAGKKRYAENEEAIQSLMARARSLSARLCEAVQLDAEAFEPLSRAYALPKDSPGYGETLESALRKAASSPLAILDLCLETAEVLWGFAEKGSRLALSDAATGAALCAAAMQGASINVKANAALMKDRAYADALMRQVEEKRESGLACCNEIYRKIDRSLSWPKS